MCVGTGGATGSGSAAAGLDARLHKVMPTLSARERATLILRSWRAKEREDPSWRRTMPAEQAVLLNHLIGLMNACNI